MMNDEISFMLGCLLACLLWAASARANLPARSGAPSPPARHGKATRAISAEKLRDFFRKQASATVKKHHVVGATLAVVYQGKVLLLKGFGHKDLAAKAPVDPKTTLFRIGSISKLFAWTAAMQLVEAGKLKLDEDIQKYLPKLRIPKTFKAPITMSHLMSHTPGLEDVLIGLFTLDPAKVLSLEQALLQRFPKRVRPPGRAIAYSNYGTAMAGYVVQQLTGVGFETYVRNKILTPLGMSHATFKQLPARLEPFMSKGYVYRGKKKWKTKPFEYISLTPAGSASASAAAMARFMLAHLQNGELDGKRILQATTARKMHQTHFRMHPKARGFAHGFIELRRSGPRIWGHLGDTIFFHSACVMIPQHQLGFFFSTNTNTGMQAYFELLQKFYATFLPEPKGKAAALGYKAPGPSVLKQYVGRYASNRRSESDLTRIMGALMQVKVALDASPGQLKISGFWKSKMIPAVAVAPDVFQATDGSQRWVFLRRGKGPVYGVFANDLPVMTFVRPPWYESLWAILGIVGLFVLCLLIGLLARPTGLMSWISSKYRPVGTARIAASLGLLMLLGYVGFGIAAALTTSEDFIFEVPSRSVFLIPYLPMTLSLAMGYFAIRAWKVDEWSLWGRSFYSVLTLSALAFAWFLLHWKIV